MEKDYIFGWLFIKKTRLTQAAIRMFYNVTCRIKMLEKHTK